MAAELDNYVSEVIILIARNTDRHVQRLAELFEAGTLKTAEAELLSDFDVGAASILELFDRQPAPAIGNQGGRLLLARVYDDVAAADAEHEGSLRIDGSITTGEQARWRILVAALLAGEAEVHGKFRLRATQSVRLAAVFERIGAGFLASGLPLHSALAYESAAERCLVLHDQAARDRCLLAAIRARHVARPRGARKALEYLSAAFVGYGYLPYRLLGWVLVQIVCFSVLLWVVARPHVGAAEALHMCLLNYLNPLGLGDIEPVDGGGQVLLVVESYLGTVSTSVFFALLVRRWFAA
jgi:hypothetical protein